MPSTDIKDYYRRAWGLGDRVPFKHGGTWADWKVNYEDQMSFEEYLQDDVIVKKLHALDRKADGGRIGFADGPPSYISRSPLTKIELKNIKAFETAKKLKFNDMLPHQRTTIKKGNWQNIGIGSGGERELTPKQQAANILSKKESPRIKNNLNSFLKKWINKHVIDYNVYEFESFVKDLNKDLKIEIKNNPAKYSSDNPRLNYLIENPTIVSSGRREGPKKELPNIQKGFSIYNMKAAGPTQTETFLNSVFYNGLVKNDPILKKEIQNYIDYIGGKKIVGGGKVGKINQANYDKVAKPSVMHILDNITGTAQAIFFNNNNFQNLEEYKNKRFNGARNYTKNLEIIEKKLGLPKNSLITSMTTVQRKLSNLFGMKGERVMTTEHILGIAQAAQSNDKNLMKQVISETRLLAKADNVSKGWNYEGFDQTKKRKLKQFNEATDLIEKQTIRDELNKFQNESKIKFTIDRNGNLKENLTTLQASLFKKVKNFFIEEVKKGKIFAKKNYINLSNDTKEILNEIRHKGTFKSLEKFKPQLKQIENNIKFLSESLKPDGIGRKIVHTVPGKIADVAVLAPFDFFTSLTAGYSIPEAVGVAATNLLPRNVQKIIPSSLASYDFVKEINEKEKSPFKQYLTETTTDEFFGNLAKKGKEKITNLFEEKTVEEKEPETGVREKPFVWKQGKLEIADNMASGGLSGVDQYILNRYK